MFTKRDVVRRIPLNDFLHPQVSPGICEDDCYIVDVKPGVLPKVAYMHPTRIFHKACDRERELTAMRICELIAPDIAVPMTSDEVTSDEDNEGVYMRFIRGSLVINRKTYTPQHRFDFGCIAVLDALIGNSDRHSANAIVTRSHVHPIDHGQAFYHVLNPCIEPFEPEASGDIRNKHVYAGIIATLARAGENANAIADLMSWCGYFTKDVLKWVKNAERETFKRKERRGW